MTPLSHEFVMPCSIYYVPWYLFGNATWCLLAQDIFRSVNFLFVPAIGHPMLFSHGLFFWVGLLILSCLEPMICLPAAASVKYALVLIVGKCINYGNDRVVGYF